MMRSQSLEWPLQLHEMHCPRYSPDSTRVNPGAQFYKEKIFYILGLQSLEWPLQLHEMHCPRYSPDSTRVNPGAQFYKEKILTCKDRVTKKTCHSDPGDTKAVLIDCRLEIPKYILLPTVNICTV